MALSLQECLRVVKEAHADLYPIWWIEKDGQYLFNMLKRGVPQEDATSNFYAVDTKSGEVSSSIPVMEVYGNDSLAEKLQHPHEIDSEDRKPLEHQIVMNGGVGWGIGIAQNNVDSLCHYGIKGQKWGVRRFQNEDRSLTPEGKERYGVGTGKLRGGVNREEARESNRAINDDYRRIYNEKTAGKELGFFEKGRIRNASMGEALLNASEKPTPETLINREISKQGDTTKNVAKHLAFTVLNPTNVVFLAADGIGAAASSAKEHNYLKKREENSVLDEKTGFYKKVDGEYTEKQDLAAVNPRFMDLNSNSKNNCMLCTTTYDLRQRGYDVTAQMDSVGYTFGDLKRWYPGAKMERNSRFDDSGRAMKQKEYVEKTLKSLKDQGDGARGNLMVYFNGGGGHSVAYEIKNGQLFIKDGQANKVYGEKTSLTNTMSVQKFLNLTSVNSFARLDNVQPDFNMIRAECCR